jgi:hypothetical protein
MDRTNEDVPAPSIVLARAKLTGRVAIPPPTKVKS